MSVFTVDGETLSYRFKITQASSKISSNLTNFTCMFDLANAPAEFWINVKSDGGDIRVTQADETTRVALEVNPFASGSSTGIIHFDSSSLSSTTDTVFYVYYGNGALSQPAIDSTYGSENAWHSDYLNVQHFEEDPSGSAPQMIDSTSNDLDGTTVGTMTSGDLVAALVGNGLDYDGTDDRVEYPTTAGSMTVGAISILVNVPSNTAHEYIWDFHTSNTDRMFMYYDTNGDVFRFGSTASGAVPAIASGTFTNKWWHVVCQWDSSEPTEEKKIKINGGSWATSTSIGAVTLPAVMGVNDQIFSGVHYEGAGTHSELRWLSAVRSEAWFDAESANLLDVGTFYSAIGEEETPAAGNVIIFGTNL